MSSHTTRLIGALLATTSVLAAANQASAQGCVSARMDANIPGVLEPVKGAPKKWETTVSWRHFKSDRHFIGDEEQVERAEEGSQVINHSNISDVSLTYNATNRSSIALYVPYIMNERSSPLRDADRVVVARSETHASGLGDIILSGRRWMLDPGAHTGNVRLGFGLKLPTGEASHQDAARVLNEDGTFSQVIRRVDQSIQTGDGAFGFVLDVQAFKGLGHNGFSLYGTGGYLFNPRETSYLQSNATTYWSVPDQYVARGGFSYDPHGKRFGFALGGRIDGVPAEDVFGGSEGRRRPGYSIDVDPSMLVHLGDAGVIGMSVPVAVYRNRTRSVPDKESGGHGDAAFADYNVIIGFGRVF